MGRFIQDNKKTIFGIFVVGFTSVVSQGVQASAIEGGLVHGTEAVQKEKKMMKIASMADVKTLVQQLMAKGHTPHDIFISLDFDGTLTRKKNKGDARLDPEAQGATKDLLTFLKTQDIPFVVNTAASDPASVYTAFRVIGAPLPVRFGTSCQGFSKRVSSEDFQGVSVKRCDFVMSGAYDKDITLHYAISKLDHAPQTVIHVDDASAMVTRIFDDATLSARYDVYAVFYPPHFHTDEPGQEEGAQRIEAHLAETAPQA